ncbi:MAG TPA: dTDP-4-dehydrorhamnose 3,5-epimerase [Spirochaetota bacterium]|nr:dTDP-4-dehydrorhamnose 3,5-epimerase [Spirochaetota bacterium]
MNFKATAIPGVYVIEPRVFTDNRGYFLETFRYDLFVRNISSVSFIQDNESKSGYGVLRGLHYQMTPHAQAKLVRVIVGSVLDVAVDIREGSPTFGKHVSVVLSAENKKQFFIPRGFAHGFVVLSREAVFSYKVDNYYNKDAERSILYNDSELAIDWQIPETDIITSAKDTSVPSLREAELFVYNDGD